VSASLIIGNKRCALDARLGFPFRGSSRGAGDEVVVSLSEPRKPHQSTSSPASPEGEAEGNHFGFLKRLMRSAEKIMQTEKPRSHLVTSKLKFSDSSKYSLQTYFKSAKNNSFSSSVISSRSKIKDLQVDIF
jgi:hypothetical protein